MNRGTASPELQKLAHCLGVPVGRLDALAGLPSNDLQLLRAQIAEALFQHDRRRFAKMAALSNSVPVALAAKVTQHALPPLLAARTAELIDPDRAADLVGRLSDEYVADVSAAMDAARAPEVVARIPAARIGTIAAELARRQEWVVIGGFVAQISEDGLAAAVRSFDGEQLLRVAYVLDDKSRLDEISAVITDEQRDQMLAAAAEQGLWIELGDMLAHLGPQGRTLLATRLRVASETVRSAVAASALDPVALAALGAA
jgi:hypothetical protein